MLTDRIGTGLLLAASSAWLAAGLAARPLVVAETERHGAQRRGALERYVRASGTAELRRNLEAADTDPAGEGYFRSCIPRDDRSAPGSAA